MNNEENQESKKKTSFFTKLKKYFCKSGMFSKVIVIFCIVYCVRIVEWGMDQFEVANTEASTLITASLALFGGELLLLCLKKIFAKEEKTTIANIQHDVDNLTYNNSSIYNTPIIDTYYDDAVG